MNETLRDLIGQSLMLSFHGHVATPEVLEALTITRPAGVILFSRNIGTPAELHALTQALQTHATTIGLLPLLIAIDQEGGIVSRLPAPFTTVPSPMAQAATGDPHAAYICAQITGQQLRAFGINTNFAPSLDINNNPRNPVIGTRSFGQDVATVTTWGREALRGYREAGVIATVKHFPGHGDTYVDSHMGLPTVRHHRGRLNAIELAPFIAAFHDRVPSVMTAHIVFEAFDTVPATLSQPILTDFLRTELCFDGVIFTDALEMRAIADTYGPIEAGLRSKAAGADVLLPCGELDDQVALAQALLAAVEFDRLQREMFETTARRLAALRQVYDITHDVPPFATPDQQLYETALEIARRSITCLGRQDVLPLAHDTRLAVIDWVLPRFSLVEEAYGRADTFQRMLTAVFPHARTLTLEPAADDQGLAQARALAEGSDVTLLVTRNAALMHDQAALGQALAASGAVLIHAAVGIPYDAAVVSGATATLLTYGDPDVSLQALVDVLAGRSEPRGVAPVSLEAVSADEVA